MRRAIARSPLPSNTVEIRCSPSASRARPCIRRHRCRVDRWQTAGLRVDLIDEGLGLRVVPGPHPHLDLRLNQCELLGPDDRNGRRD